jgi:hypothetical protein
MSRKHLPAAVPVSIGCSVAFRTAPRARTVRTPKLHRASIAATATLLRARSFTLDGEAARPKHRPMGQAAIDVCLP